MSTVRLLDINVLIALVDPWHVFHVAATEWMASNSVGKWATCPLTENGFLRVFGHPQYKNGPGSPAAALPFLQQMYASPGHMFWRLDLSFATGRVFESLEGCKSAAPLKLDRAHALHNPDNQCAKPSIYGLIWKT
jgi:predicted nucleic acid-binding protein